ncbi:MAG: lysylphosphatidylglycerol synthase transmembrane domain-containing protein, partial [Phycisphaerales bacterium]
MPEPKAEKSKYLFLFLRVLVVSVGIVWAGIWLSRGQRWSNLISIFAKMKNLEVLGAFIVALGIFLICLVIISFRWWLLLRTQSVFIGLLTAVRLNFLGWFYNNFMPGSVGGDLLRAWYVTKHTDKRFEAALSVFVDRAIGLLSTLIIALFFYVFFLRGRHDSLTLTGDDRSLEFFSKYGSVIIWVVVIFVGV